jgi:hypothetical protein
VHSKSVDEHFDHLLIVADRLNAVQLKIKPSKCVWFATELKILGHIVTFSSSGGTIKMDPAKIVAIKDRVEPKNVKQVQQFLGMSNYYRRFIRDYARIVAPLYELLKKENKFLWSEFCKNSFSDLKKALVSYPVLRQPDFSKQFILHTDASTERSGIKLFNF